MKGRKWTILVVVLVLMFSVGCATGAGARAKPPTDHGHEFNGYRQLPPTA